MSVAFRRESDEEHLEPRFELPIPAGPNLVTARGLAMIHARVAELEREVAEATDPAEREVALRTLRYWNTRAVTAVLAPALPEGEVAFGSRVRVLLKGRERWFEIVGDDEADPQAGRIAFTAPLARALIGSATGEVVPFAGDPDGLEVIEIAATLDPRDVTP